MASGGRKEWSQGVIARGDRKFEHKFECKFYFTQGWPSKWSLTFPRWWLKSPSTSVIMVRRLK